MPTPSAGPRRYFWIFTASGFSGLIYESIWTHYLKLFLGHAAYAQTLVLAIFMGGMAIGAWLCGRWSHRWPNLLLGYALAEGAVGVLALVFHPIFVTTVEAMATAVLPALGPGAASTAAKWAVGALLILPQSILLGMTFPLMGAGVLRRFPAAQGTTIATLYFVNSLGGAIGVLASGFWLIDRFGLPGTIVIAGCLNILLAAVVVRTSRAEVEWPPERAMPVATAEQKRTAPLGLLLGVAALTGSSSFFYEIGWIRMLALVLGSSTHAFELMLSAFILGLALGGLWIRRRIDRVGSPVALLGRVQVAMGLSALATLPLHALTFDWMERLMKSIDRTEAGYVLLSLASQGMASLVMLPAAICAGMTLPLIMRSLLAAGWGERSIGYAYGANTIGAIVGVFAAVHLAMPLVGLKNVIVGGAAVDLVLGVVLLASAGAAVRRAEPAAALALSVLAVAVASATLAFDPHRLSSGVFGTNQSLAAARAAKVLFYADGKTSTVAVLERPGRVVEIRTNGKTDGSIDMSGSGQHQLDESTMVLTAALPLLLAPHARTVANVGLGTGLSTHTLLTHAGVARVDTVEIEAGIVAGARAFLPRNRLAYEDRRSVITVEDAKTFFSSRGGTYDVIVSEPSNPWVSGVSSLFSREFHRLARRHLAPDGIFAQWIQLYEIEEGLVVSVLKSIDESFGDYAVFAANYGDMIVVATPAARLPALPAEFPAQPALVAELTRLGIGSPQDIAVRELGTKRSLAPLLARYDVPANSDYHPVLDQHANRARFLRRSAQDLIALALEVLPHVEMLDGQAPPTGETRVGLGTDLSVPHPAGFATIFRDHMLGARTDGSLAAQAASLLAACQEPSDGNRVEALLGLGLRVVPYLRPAENEMLWSRLQDSACVGGLTPDERGWLDLLTGVGRRDADVMATASRRLLAAGRGRTPAERRYLCAAGMLGSVARGRPEEARDLWLRWGVPEYGRERPSLLLRLLAAHAGVEVATP